MKQISKIQVTSKSDLHGQIVNDALTPGEKKILIHMLNAGINNGQVRNKVFGITKTGNNTADIVVVTIGKSEITGAKQTRKNRVKIKYS